MTISPGGVPTQWATIEAVPGVPGYESATEALVVTAVGVFLRVTTKTPSGTVVTIAWAPGVKTATDATTGTTSLVTI